VYLFTSHAEVTGRVLLHVNYISWSAPLRELRELHGCFIYCPLESHFAIIIVWYCGRRTSHRQHGSPTLFYRTLQLDCYRFHVCWRCELCSWCTL